MTEELNIRLDSIFKVLNLKPKNVELFKTYITILLHWNRKVNLISRKDTTKIENFILHSLLFFKVFGENGQTIVDLGSGAGFPAIVLKIYNPTIKITMIDSNHKKTAFLNYICSILNLECSIINNSFENIRLPLDTEITTVKGVNINQDLLDIIQTRIKGRFLVYFTSPKINLPLKMIEEKRFNSFSMKVYEL